MNQKTKKQTQLNALYAPFKDCQMCPLSKAGRINLVFGIGNANAKLMIIGEAPGKEEDLAKEPFVGRSGKLLTQCLENLNITRPDVFIANIVKCRPPNNRTPLKKELSVCKKLLLERQIEIIKPKAICTLGACATTALLETKKTITLLRGTTQKYKNIPTIPAFHPAYILRYGSKQSVLQADLQKAWDISQN